MKSAASPKSANAGTLPDEIPAVHVLEAAQSQDRKETEDLLAGFDRPGRGPKVASKERDFVDYYAKKKPGALDSGPMPSARAGASAGAGAAPEAATTPRVRQRDISTVVVPRKREGVPAWLAWCGAAGLMMLIGGGVAYLATGDTHPSSQLPTGPSAATTITAATPIPHASNDNVPPPEPSTATTTTTSVSVVSPSSVPDAPPRSSGRREPRVPPGSSGASAGAGSAPGAAGPRGTNATDDSKPPPRDDFIRDM